MFRFWSRTYVLHLETEIEWLKDQYAHERQRAETAIDELLRTRVAAGPVAPPPLPSEAERRVQQLLNDPEFVQVGNAE
jgi:hypothetical protein